MSPAAPCSAPACSPYAVFRAADLPWSRPWSPPPAVIQGELFALQARRPPQPTLLACQP